jgi:Protein of unknown function (DUF2752)
VKRKIILKILFFMLFLGVILVVFFLYNPAQHSFFLSCPFKSITGYHCPGCGSQRAIHNLLHFEFYEAFRLNPLMVISTPLILYGLGVKIYNNIFKKHHRVHLFYNPWFIYGYFIVALVYWVLRNIPFVPFSYLAPHG